MLKLDETWTWDFWIADNGAEYHLYFLKASKQYKDPLTRHDLIRNPDRRQTRSSIGHAVSKDLTSWQVHPDVLSHGSDGQFDDLATWTGSVIKGPERTSFLTLLNAIHGSGTFFLFAFLTIIALVYFQRRVPETKNRSLQEIERDLSRGKVSKAAGSK